MHLHVLPDFSDKSRILASHGEGTCIMSTNIATPSAPLTEENKVDPTQRKRSKSTAANQQSSAVMKVVQPTTDDQIRDRDYQLYIERGARDGHELQDWLDAEFELLANR